MNPDLILRALIGANLAAGAAIVLVLALRRIARHRFGPRAAYALWLLAPVAAFATLIPARMTGARGEPLAVGFGLPETTAMMFAPVRQAAEAQARDLAPILLALWFAGVLATVAIAIIRSWRLTTDPMAGPALVGVARPRLLLPADFETRFDAREQRLVLAHEAEHLAARHPLINGLIELGRCLNWFNPLVHVGAFFARVDQELACDAAVVERFPGERRTYAETLLKTQLAPAFLPLGCQWPGRSKPLLAERIEMIVQDKTPRRLAGMGAVAALVALTGLAAWAAQPPQAPEDVVLTGNVSLTNAGGKLTTFPTRNAARVAAAIRAGDPRGVLQAGGTATDVANALRTLCQGDTSPNCQQLATAIPGSELFTIGPDGRLGVSAINAEQTGRFANHLPEGAADGIPTPPNTRDNRNMLQQWLDAGIPRDSIQVTPSADGVGQNLRLVGPAPAEALARIGPPGLPPPQPVSAK